MKSYVENYVNAYRAMLSDVARNIEGLTGEVERDFDHLSRLLSCRGDQTILVDFPDIMKWLDKSLQEGALSTSGLPGTKGISRSSPVPKLFRGLFLRVFDKSGYMLDDPDPTCIFYLRQLFGAFKKYKKGCKDVHTQNAVCDFYATDHSLPYPRLNFDEPWNFSQSEVHNLHVHSLAPELYDSDHTDHADFIVQQVFDRMAGSYPAFHINDPSVTFKHGPGAVSEKLGDGDSKYLFTSWPSNLEPHFPAADCAIHSFGEWKELQGYDTSNSVISEMYAVPKTAKGPRLIAAEPQAHMWCQQAVRSFLEHYLKSSFLRHSIDFRSQDRNRSWALRASKLRDYSTIDLSAASDRVSLRLIESVFRKNIPLLGALAACRTRYIYQDINPEMPMVYKLKKFSTMGSACTFPVQSMIFASLAISSILYKRGLKVTTRNVESSAKQVTVFGDDIIIPSDCYDVLCELLCRYGFVVNESKSCHLGGFRESCGMDAYDGHDVTPSYITQFYEKRKPESISSLIDLSNNAFRKGLFETSFYLESLIPAHFRVQVPYGSGLVGLESFSPRLKTRWNRDLQKEEIRVVKLQAKQRVLKVNDPSSLLQYFTEKPEPELPWESGVRMRARRKVRLGWASA